MSTNSGNIYVISDLHFGHKNIITFKKTDGSLLRPFDSMETMHEHMIASWNSVVKNPNQDLVYVVGDAAFGQLGLSIFKQLNGRKRLVLGNHDTLHMTEYYKYFDKIYGVKFFGRSDIVMTHVPVHESQLNRWSINVHGHLHGHNLPDKRYVNVSCELLGYKPVPLDDLLEVAKTYG